MSVIPIWGFGINRLEIEILIRALTLNVTGLADDRVLIVDQGARTPVPPRPYIGIFIGEPVGSYPSYGERRQYPTDERWTVTVTDASDATYTVVVLGTSFSFVASSSTITAIRDGLITAIGVPVGFTAVPVSTDQIAIVSTVLGISLVVSATPATLTVLRTKSAWYERFLQQVEVQVDFLCASLIDIEDPLPVQSAQSLATLVEVTMNNPTINVSLRNCGHIPVRITRIGGSDTFQGQQISEDTVQLILRTTSRIDAQVDAILAIPTNPVVAQM